jgi:hypothetical protein
MKKTYYYVSYNQKKQSWVVKSVYLYTIEEMVKENIDYLHIPNGDHVKALVTIAPVNRQLYVWDTTLNPLNDEVYENIQKQNCFVFDDFKKLKTGLYKLVELHFRKENEDLNGMEKVLHMKRAEAEQKHFRLNILLNEDETELPVDFVSLGIDFDSGGLLIT